LLGDVTAAIRTWETDKEFQVSRGKRLFSEVDVPADTNPALFVLASRARQKGEPKHFRVSRKARTFRLSTLSSQLATALFKVSSQLSALS
jgi:hypothetical protein